MSRIAQPRSLHTPVIMSKDDKALFAAPVEIRGEEAPPDISGVLFVQPGLVTEGINRRRQELNSTASLTFRTMRSTARSRKGGRAR